MVDESRVALHDKSAIVLTGGEAPALAPGDLVRILNRSPEGHDHLPVYLFGRTGWVEAAIEPRGIDKEEDAFAHNAGRKLHYYRIGILMTDIWPRYEGSPTDGLRIEIFETWLERL